MKNIYQESFNKIGNIFNSKVEKKISCKVVCFLDRQFYFFKSPPTFQKWQGSGFLFLRKPFK